ncbi:class I SAM-dependent methyltransferase [Actinocorallia populi]|uniref:class I SAM-dependent methyltransferase n=1 Tax=Actinocorallia populi TaxID=2079200 RepID=UPI000D087CD6|nr:class I SAM-dependent methyltransferase [Actinocorallia populi]
MGERGAELSGVEWTALVTLYLRAVESRSKESILKDRAASEAVRRLGGDFGLGSLKMRLTAGDRYLVVLRARQLDLWAADFLARHPDAVVVQLGCGLDSRASRLDVPPGVLWFDVDLPEVAELRRRLFPDREGHRTIGASVTESRWWEEVPWDRPVLAIAEGLLMYLEEQEVRRLLERLTDRFTTGTLLFDGVAPWVVRISERLPRAYRGFGMHWATRNAWELEQWNPRLRRIEEVAPLARYPVIPSRFYRCLYRVLSLIPPLRNELKLFRFEF